MFFKGDIRNAAEVNRSQFWKDTEELSQAKELLGTLTAVGSRFAGASSRRVSALLENFYGACTTNLGS